MNKFDINNLRVASPCPVGWQNMTGDSRKRFCDLCSLNVYNFSEMTAAEVEVLVRRSEGRVCARMFRRADGTVITRDCPVGLRAYRKRVSRFAGAALAMIIGLFSAGYGQSEKENNRKIVAAADLNIGEKQGGKGQTRLYGTLYDMYGAVVPGTTVKLTAADKKRTWSTNTNAEGVFSMPSLPPGFYTLEIKPVMDLKGIIINDLEIKAETLHELNISLELTEIVEVVGGIGSGTPIEISSEAAPPNVVLGRIMIAPTVPPKKP